MDKVRIGFVGVGGMGAVWEAEKLATHESFAVKMIAENLAADQARVLQYQVDKSVAEIHERELETLSKLAKAGEFRDLHAQFRRAGCAEGGKIEPRARSPP